MEFLPDPVIGACDSAVAGCRQAAGAWLHQRRIVGSRSKADRTVRWNPVLPPIRLGRPLDVGGRFCSDWFALPAAGVRSASARQRRIHEQRSDLDLESVTIVPVLLLAVVASGSVSRMLPIAVPAPLVQIGLGAHRPWRQLPGGTRSGAVPPALPAAVAVPRRLVDSQGRAAQGRVTVVELALGLVLFTVLGMGLLIHWMIPAIPLAVAFALAAVVSPTDPIAVSAIAPPSTDPEADDAHPGRRVAAQSPAVRASSRRAHETPIPGLPPAHARICAAFSCRSRSRAACDTDTPRSRTSFTASSLNSRPNFRCCISILRCHKHPISVSTEPAAAQRSGAWNSVIRSRSLHLPSCSARRASSVMV